MDQHNSGVRSRWMIKALHSSHVVTVCRQSEAYLQQFVWPSTKQTFSTSPMFNISDPCWRISARLKICYWNGADEQQNPVLRENNLAWLLFNNSRTLACRSATECKTGLSFKGLDPQLFFPCSLFVYYSARLTNYKFTFLFLCLHTVLPNTMGTVLLREYEALNRKIHKGSRKRNRIYLYKTRYLG